MNPCRKTPSYGCNGNKRSFRTLDAIIDDYIAKYRDHAEAELDFFRRSPSHEAIEYAAKAIDHRRKRFAHQRRLTRQSLHTAYLALIGRETELLECNSFEAVHRIVQSIASTTRGLGKLYAYDTALRLSAHLKSTPTFVYLHAGVRIGAKRLGLPTKRDFLELSELPPPLRRLQAHEIENLLCIYKNQLGSVA